MRAIKTRLFLLLPFFTFVLYFLTASLLVFVIFDDFFVLRLQPILDSQCRRHRSGGGSKLKPPWCRTANMKQFESDDYYQVLGLCKKTAKEKDVKKSYRKLALQYHPDKIVRQQGNEKERMRAEKIFIKISEAYEVLSVEKTRHIYNTYGKEGLELYKRGMDPKSAGFSSNDADDDRGHRDGGYGGNSGYYGGKSGSGNEDRDDNAIVVVLIVVCISLAVVATTLDNLARILVGSFIIFLSLLILNDDEMLEFIGSNIPQLIILVKETLINHDAVVGSSIIIFSILSMIKNQKMMVVFIGNVIPLMVIGANIFIKNGEVFGCVFVVISILLLSKKRRVMVLYVGKVVPLLITMGNTFIKHGAVFGCIIIFLSIFLILKNQRQMVLVEKKVPAPLAIIAVNTFIKHNAVFIYLLIFIFLFLILHAYNKMSKLATLKSMGFDSSQTKHTLDEYDGNLEQATNHLLLLSKAEAYRAAAARRTKRTKITPDNKARTVKEIIPGRAGVSGAYSFNAKDLGEHMKSPTTNREPRSVFQDVQTRNKESVENTATASKCVSCHANSFDAAAHDFEEQKKSSNTTNKPLAIQDAQIKNKESAANTDSTNRKRKMQPELGSIHTDSRISKARMMNETSGRFDASGINYITATRSDEQKGDSNTNKSKSVQDIQRENEPFAVTSTKDRKRKLQEDIELT